jgi:hypothetical protein
LIQFTSATYIEDESQTAGITISRTGSTQATTVVNFATSNGTAIGGLACTSGIDYVTTNQPVVFNPGEVSKVVGVPMCGDLMTEPFETINLTLTGAGVGNPSTAVLTENDTANQFRSTTEIDMNLGGPAAPYPSQITVSGMPTQFASMRVTLYDLAHQLPDNIDVLLVSPTGTKFVVMGDAGGPNPMATPVTLTFSDVAGQVLPNNGPLTTNKFEPTTWESPVTSFPAPAPPAPYNEPGSAVGGSGPQTLVGSFGFSNPNGVWNLYVRDDNGTFEPEVLSGVIAGGWGLEFLQTTAAGVSLSGRVTTAEGAGIRNARVTVSGNSLPEARVATTGSFGYFSFDGLTAGETYVVTVNAQRYTFTVPSRVFTLVDNIVDADFVAEPSGR